MEPKLKRKRRWKPRFDFVTFVYAGIGCGIGALLGYGIGGIIGAIVGGIIGAIAGFLYGAFGRSEPKYTRKEETRKQEIAKKPNKEIPEKPKVVEKARKPEKTITIKKEIPQKPKITETLTKQPIQYLGNTNTMEIHDLSNTTTSCRIGLIKQDHKVYFKSIQEVEQAINNDGYNGCRWCLTKYHID